MFKVEKNKNKAVSLIMLILTIVILLILVSVVVINFKDKNVNDAGNLATMQSNMQKMLDIYEVKYNDLLVKYKGDNSKITTSDIEELQNAIDDSVPDEYKGKYQATISGIKYIGNDEEEKQIATEMGIYITDDPI